MQDTTFSRKWRTLEYLQGNAVFQNIIYQMVHFTAGRCTLQPRGTLQPGSCKKVVSVKLFWKLAGALETVCICKGTLDSRIMLVAKLAQMAKTMVFDASGNQTHETRTNAIQGQVLLTRISWQALCKLTSRWICKTVRNVLDNVQTYHCTGPSNSPQGQRQHIAAQSQHFAAHRNTLPAQCHPISAQGLAYGCTKPLII